MNFLLRSFKLTTISSLFKIRKKVKEKSKRHFIIFDIIYCSLKYKTAFHDYLEFEFYNLNHKQRCTYLTNGKNNEIVRKFNNKAYWHILDNKDEFNDYYKKYLKREYLKPNSSLEDFNKFIKNKSNIIVKPVDGVGGKGIKIISTKEDNLYNKYKDYLLEELIVQNKKLSQIYDKSVNSLRLFTFYDGKNAYLLQRIIKFGNGGEVDNFSSGGMYAFLDDNGTIITPAIDRNDNIYKVHPYSNKEILGFNVPLFESAKNMVLEASKELKEVKYIGWDVAITNDGACIIEGNCYPGVFQIKPSFSKDKIGLLPEYERIMNIKL